MSGDANELLGSAASSTERDTARRVIIMVYGGLTATVIVGSVAFVVSLVLFLS